MSRPRTFLEQALDHVRNDALREHGVDASALLDSVSARLDRGDRVFGAAYLADEWNGLQGAREGLGDALAYLALTLQRAHLRSQLTGELVGATLEAAAHIAAANALLETAEGDVA